MTKAGLIEEVCRAMEMTRKDSEDVVDAIFDGVVRALRAGDKIEIRGLGSFGTVALLAAVGSLLSAVVADNMSGTRHKSNVELLA